MTTQQPCILRNSDVLHSVGHQTGPSASAIQPTILRPGPLCRTSWLRGKQNWQAARVSLVWVIETWNVACQGVMIQLAKRFEAALLRLQACCCPAPHGTGLISMTCSQNCQLPVVVDSCSRDLMLGCVAGSLAIVHGCRSTKRIGIHCYQPGAPCAADRRSSQVGPYH